MRRRGAQRRLTVWGRLALGLLGIALLCASPAHAERRVALVVGVEAYTKLKALANPRRDAKAMADLLRANGYDVDHVENPDRARFERALSAFRVKASGADEAFVYYSGHGMEAFERGERNNILAPIDVEVDCETREAYAAVTLSQVLRVIASAKKQVVVVDACRDHACRDSYLFPDFAGCVPGRSGRRHVARGETGPSVDVA